MKVATHFKYKSQKGIRYLSRRDEYGQRKQEVMIIFPTDVEFSVETVTKSMLSTSKIILYIYTDRMVIHKILC